MTDKRSKLDAMMEEFEDALKSQVADLVNAPSTRFGGACSAAVFLQQFVGDTPWAHFDIAGTAFDVPNIPYYRPGATGAGVRIMIDLALYW